MKAVISGFFGFGNAGDEGILAAMLDALGSEAAARGDRFEPVVLSADPPATERVHGVRAVDRFKAAAVWQAVRSCDLLISGGGSLLQDVTSRRSLLYYLGIVRLALFFRKPVFVYGQGIGPIANPTNIRLTRYVLNRVDGISVRDEGSRRRLLDWGVHGDHIEVTADPVFGWQEVPLLAGSQSACGHPAPVLGVAMRPWPGMNWRPVIEALKVLVESGWGIQLVALYEALDAAVLRVLAAELAPTPVETMSGIEDPREWLRRFAEVDVVLGMRLHGLIFAAMAGSIPVGIAYDPKVSALFREMGLQDWNVCLQLEDLTSTALIDSVTAAWERRGEFRRHLRSEVERLGVRARHTAELCMGVKVGSNAER